MKQAKLACQILSVLALLSTSAIAAGRNLILPGRSIGQVKIGAEVPKSLGKPTSSEGATGKFWESWVSKKPPHKGALSYRLDIHSQHGVEDIEPKVVQVRITSPMFSTPKDISTHSNLSQIQRQFPNARLYATYISEHRHGPVYVYDDVKHGIAFEIWRGRSGKDNLRHCIAISVHAPGQRVVPAIEEQPDDWKTVDSSK